MIFCQACGAQNAPDARFCNMCGTSIAKVGTPGGPIEHTQLGVGLVPETTSQTRAVPADMPSSYPGGGNTMSVQLDAIGIRSTKKTWATLGGIALLLFVLGGVATFFTMRGGHEQMGGAAEADPFEVGSPEIQGADEVDFVSGRREGEGMPQPTPSADAGTSASPTTTTQTSTPTPTSNGATPTTMSPTTTPSTMEAAPSTMTTTPAETPSTMEPTPTTEPATTPGPTDEPPEGEVAIEMYTSRVRYLVRRYYLPRSQACFEHATRNNPSLHGQVVVSLTIGSNGHVTASSVARNSTGDTSLGSCLATQVRSWELTPPPNGESITMTLPFSR